jgi:uncharacterized protein (DUF58 family)
METKELLKKIRRIEIKTKGLTNQIFSGEYHSAFKGRGMAFSEVREYHVGDDVRNIDWNVTARFNDAYVKVFEEERELTVMLLIDLSGSIDFGSSDKSKRDLSLEIAAVLGFSAVSNNDKVGAIFFTDQIEKFIPPAKGRKHILYILREIIEFKPEGSGTDLGMVLSHFRNVIKRRSIAFLISDFMDEKSFFKSLQIARKKHDLVAIRLKDHYEQNLPGTGLFRLTDSETGKHKWIQTLTRSGKLAYQEAFAQREKDIELQLRKSGADFTTIATHESHVKPLMQLFKRRVGR